MSHRIAKSASRIMLIGLLFLMVSSQQAAQAQTRLLRFPDICKDKVAFCYAGDIWIAPSSGGTAARLTAHPGREEFPKFSPDGKKIAFTGQYDGDEQVYVIPAEGGIPKQLTYYPAEGPLPPRWGMDNQVYGWTPDGKEIIFRSMRDSWDISEARLYKVSVGGGLPVALPMPASGAGDLSPDGSRIAYSPLMRDFRTWKRYQGGWAQDLYIFDLKSYEVEQITNNPRTDRDPMWIGDKIYFASDRDGTLNIYAYDIRSRETKQITTSKKWDVRWPSADEDGQIVYELDGQLNVLDTNSGETRAISILVPNDGLASRPSRISAADLIENWGISPKGERALFAARGDIFSAPIEDGPTRNLTQSSNAHDKWPAWSPDGSKIAFISDLDGEEQIYTVNQDGSGKIEQLTTGGEGMRYDPKWSPDGKRIAFSDKNGKLYVVVVKSKSMIEVAHDKSGNLKDYSWSPHGGHLAFSLTDPNNFRSLYIWSVDSGKVNRVTGAQFNEYNPVWDPNGKYLYYLSDREFAPQIGAIEWNYVVNRETGIFALALRKDVKSPFPPKSDEVTIGEKEKKDEGKNDGKKKEKKIIKIDFDGLSKRVARVPVSSDNYQRLAVTEDYLLYMRGSAFFYGRERDPKPALQIFSLKTRKEKTLVKDVSGYVISRDGSKVLVKQDKDYNLYEVKFEAKDSTKTVSTKNLKIDRMPEQEWAEIFDEVWRRYRDFFYAKNMHGYDWKALRDQYKPLLKYVAHRSDLNYVIGEMIAELDVSHAYIVGGDFDIPPRPKVALPGARFALDEANGRYKIAKIFDGENEEDRYRAPLTEIGVDMKVGDYVLAIDGEELDGGANPYRLLRNKADRPVTLTVSSKPTTKGSREVTFNPISSETELIYLNWVEKNRHYVSAKTNGRVGYLHIPDMDADGIREFIKWYYGQLDKEGLVIDERGNGGGNVSQMLIERLRRVLLSVDYSRNSEYPHPYPSTVFNGYMVCLLNETSASDGDIFPAMFKKAALGKLIGKRSWGGVVGIEDHGPLLDGGTVYVPEYGLVSTEGKWDIENHGVDPDIVVENDPKSLIEDKDNQLDRGIEEVMKLIVKNPKRMPPLPPYPVKAK